MEHLVGSLLGIMILAPGYNGSFCASDSSSADTSWIIFVMSNVVSYWILWFMPVVGSTFICVVTCCSFCLNKVLTSRFVVPMNSAASGWRLFPPVTWVREFYFAAKNPPWVVTENCLLWSDKPCVGRVPLEFDDPSEGILPWVALKKFCWDLLARILSVSIDAGTFEGDEL